MADQNATGNSADAAAATITADYLRDIIVEISDDSYAGRGPGSPGDEKARMWLAQELEAIGLEPGGEDGSWQQPFDLIGVNASQPDTWMFEGHGKSMALQQWDQFIASSGVQAERAEIENAELVFVGYGIQAPEYDWDDYSGADVTGKVVVIMNNDPDWDPELFAGETRLWYGRWDYKYLTAAQQARWAQSLFTRSRQRAIPSRSCRHPGPVSNSNCRLVMKRVARSRPG